MAAIPVGGDVYGSDPMPVTVRPATTADLPAMATSLARAFADDPVKLFLTGGKELPVKRTEPFFMVFGRMQLPHGLVYTTPGREGGALWAPPGRWKVPVTQIIKATPQFLRLYGWRFVPNLGVLSTLEKAHPTEPHYYLEFLGTDPAHQGRGIGSAAAPAGARPLRRRGRGRLPRELQGVQRPLLRPPRLHRHPRAGARAQRAAPVAHVARPR